MQEGKFVDDVPTRLVMPESKLLTVLNAEALEQREQEARQESVAKVATKVVVRAVAFNMDVVMLCFVIFFSVSLGYVVARNFGLSPAEIKEEVTEYFSFFTYFVLLVLSCLVKLATKSGLIAKAVQNTLGSGFAGGAKSISEWLSEIFSPKTELKWNVLTSQNTEKQGKNEALQ